MAETSGSRGTSLSKPSFAVLDPFAPTTPPAGPRKNSDVDPLESTAPTAFIFPIHSTLSARASGRSTGSSGGHPSGLPSRNPERRSSSSRKPTPALSASLEDLALKETKSRSSTSSRTSKTTPEPSYLILPDAPLPQPTHTSRTSSRRPSVESQQQTRLSTASRSSSTRTISTPTDKTPTPRAIAAFTPPDRPPPKHDLPPTPPSPASKPSRMSLPPLPVSSSMPALGPPVQPSVQALRSRYVRPASPGTVPIRSASPVSQTGPLTPPAEQEKHHGFFSSLRKKKSTLSRPSSSQSTKEPFGGSPRAAGLSSIESAPSAGMSTSPSSSSFHKGHARVASQTSVPPEPEAAAATSAAAFDDYELTDLTPTTLTAPRATSSYFAAGTRAPPVPASGSRKTELSPVKDTVDRRPSTTSQCSSAGGLCSIAPTSWDLDAELNALERRDRRKKGLGEKESLRIKGKEKETKKEKKERLKREEERFDPDARPTAKDMFDASLYEVIDGDGKSHMFGDLIKGQRTIVVFIRHWYCPLCSDYVYSIVEQVQPEALERAGAKLIIIGNGSPKVVHSYQNKIFNCPFPVYTDPTLELYRALGMTRQTGDGGLEEEKGDYVKHGTLSGTLMVAKNVGKMGITLQPGHFTQLGGEFVLGPGLAVHYTHRMHNTRGHAPIKVALAHAGVVGSRRPRPPSDKPAKQASANAYTGGDSELDRLGWKVSRDSELERMRTWREERRRGRLFNPEGETIRETIHEGDSASEDGTHRSPVGRRRSSAALTADGTRRGSADTAPYSLRHHHSAAPLALPEADDDVVDISRRPSTPESKSSHASHVLASAATFGFPAPPEHAPISPIPEISSPSMTENDRASSYVYRTSSEVFARKRESTVDSDLSPIVDLNDPVGYQDRSHLSPDIGYEQQSRYRSSSGGTMGFPNPTFLHDRAHSGETVQSNVVGPESETSSFSRRDSRDEDVERIPRQAGEEDEDDNGSEDSSYDVLEPVEAKMGEEFGYIVPGPAQAQAA